VLIAAITTAPAVLFFDPAKPWTRRYHVPREPRALYRLVSDDVAYVASSRTWQRTASNLFVPHNTHIVPAWRMLTWALVACAGNLERVPEVLAFASYSILVAVMLMSGRLVARETGQTSLGLVSMVLVGTTSLMLTPAAWYSGGQPLWAGFGILATLWYAQSYRRKARPAALLLTSITAPLAGWFWTVGHLAGPVAAVYLWLDGRRHCRIGAAWPLAATTIAVALSLGIASSRIQSAISFHGRTVRQAARPVQGLLHTLQAIPENLIFGNLGLAVETTQAQGAVLTALGLVALALTLPRSGLHRWRRIDQQPEVPHRMPASGGAIGPLEVASATLVVASYSIEWTFRGYLDYRFLRMINMRSVVPWYDLIPQIGAVLFAASWWSRVRPLTGQPGRAASLNSLTLLGSVGLLVLIVIAVVLHRPRVDYLVRESTPPFLPSELARWPITRLQTMRANVLLMDQAEWQRSALRRLDRGEALARRMGLGQDAIRAAFGHTWLPGSVGRLQPELYDLYDTAALLDLPEHGRPADPDAVRNVLADFFIEEPEPRPSWVRPIEPWPPDRKTAAPQ
jgi:hypothetical protein